MKVICGQIIKIIQKKKWTKTSKILIYLLENPQTIPPWMCYSVDVLQVILPTVMIELGGVEGLDLDLITVNSDTAYSG